jgi:hypothetical protein
MSETLIADILKYLKESGFMFLSFSVGLFGYRIFNRFYRLIFLQVGIAIGFYIGAYQVVEYQKAHGLRMSNEWMYNAYILVEVVILLYAAFWYLPDIRMKRITLSGIVVFSIIYFSELIMDGPWHLLNITLVCAGLILVTIFVMVLHDVINKTDFSWKVSPDLWVSIGILIYFACNVPFLGLFHQLMKYDATITDRLFYITEILASIRYFTFSVAFLLAIRAGVQKPYTL